MELMKGGVYFSDHNKGVGHYEEMSSMGEIGWVTLRWGDNNSTCYDKCDHISWCFFNVNLMMCSIKMIFWDQSNSISE